ncbi:GtrA family protein [Asanoa sp. WMMD1127]|uniref:GtrA family protein n=1 Tax=Asanoa sp. WMMD1127 TaxID=3016107 RepID=UPI002417AC24|nr:GtrA family protein [Asanoa sp. WMMD1127]MDG4825389.1 GtrA family protein [Asanoa sp. WMMD1127]
MTRSATRARAERVGDALTGWSDRLPTPLRRWVSRELVGFAILGGCTLAVDLALLWALRRWTPLPVPVAVTVAYVAAVALNYVLNRVVTFRSHARVVGEASRYTAVAIADYVLTVSVTTALTAGGTSLAIARPAAAAVVAILNYAAARWWIFRGGAGPS